MAAARAGIEQQLDEVRERLKLRGPRLVYRSLYARLPDLLGDGETVVAFGDGYVHGRGRRSTGAYVVLTDRRLLAVRDEVEEIPLDSVRAVELMERSGSGVLGFAGGAFRLETVEGDRVVRVRARSVCGAVVAAITPQEVLPPAAGDPVDAIRRLGERRDAGLISAAEFDAKKAELLGRI
jgi:hypothetical protein